MLYLLQYTYSIDGAKQPLTNKYFLGSNTLRRFLVDNEKNLDQFYVWEVVEVTNEYKG